MAKLKGDRELPTILVIAGLLLISISFYIGVNITPIVSQFLIFAFGNALPFIGGVILLVIGATLHMKDIIFQKLLWYQKGIFYLGWLGVTTPIFWLCLILKKFAFPQGNHKEFFNPDTFKVAYVFGWIFLVTLLLISLF
ncbi:MAG: hypothetical protein Q8R00_00155 [Candidatus Nanoarchaeia archaeon]|nr:hypothetical protein [Candidatus Nanoarchaeia archaeon]